MATPLDSSVALDITSQTQAVPSFTDSASPTSTPGQGGDQDRNNPLMTHYFVFIALLLCIVGIGLLLMWRRKRKLSLLRYHTCQQPARARFAGAERQWRGGELGVEQSIEGLDERGEAPPPYVSKQAEGRTGSGIETHAAGLDVPLQTLSREQAALRELPGYEARPAGTAGESELGDCRRSQQ